MGIKIVRMNEEGVSVRAFHELTDEEMFDLSVLVLNAEEEHKAKFPKEAN